MRAADPAVKLRAKAHDELRSRQHPGTGTVSARISGQQEDEESKDKRSCQLPKRGSSRKERKKQRRAPDPAVGLRAKQDAAAHDGSSSNSAGGEVDRGGLGSAQQHQDVQGGRHDGEQHLPQKRMILHPHVIKIDPPLLLSLFKRETAGLEMIAKRSKG